MKIYAYHVKKKKSPQSLPKVLILLNKIYTSVIIEII